MFTTLHVLSICRRLLQTVLRGSVSFRRISIRRILILTLSLSLTLTLTLTISLTELKFGELKFGELKFGEMKGHRAAYTNNVKLLIFVIQCRCA